MSGAKVAVRRLPPGSRSHRGTLGAVILAAASVWLAGCVDQAEHVSTDTGELSVAVCAKRGYNVIIGTDGPDVLMGTHGPDCIFGLGGDDVLRGRGGADYLVGGAGDDEVHGGPGDDVIWVDRHGFEEFVGGPGSDEIVFLD